MEQERRSGMAGRTVSEGSEVDQHSPVAETLIVPCFELTARIAPLLTVPNSANLLSRTSI